MQKLLILTASNPASNPRPRRMIENLKGYFELYAMGIGTQEIKGVKTFSFPAYSKRNLLQEIRLYCDVLFASWERLIWTKNRLEIVPFLEEYEFDQIICFDLPLLPIALKYKKRAKLIFDAQEYFPEWLTSSLRWTLLFKHFNTYLCREFLPQCDAILTVSPSFVERYKRDFGISPNLYLSLPYFYGIEPKPCDERNIKILYHGSLSSNRGIDQLFELCDRLDERFSLDLILVGGEARQREKIFSLLKELQKRGKRIRILPPVQFEDIIPFGSNYDIGLYFMPPNTYNLLCTLPNKFFEYIGSSLAILSTPNTDVIPFVREYGIGKLALDFSPKAMADLINSLRADEVYGFKQASYRASKKLNNQENQSKILSLLKKL